MRCNIQKYKINFTFLKHLVSQIFKKKSPIRLFHNFYLRNINIEGKVLDLGSGIHSSYFNFINKKNYKIYYADKFHLKKDNFFKVDLENEIDIQPNFFDNIILFNVLEHIENYKRLIQETKKILKPGGKLELFVPFMHSYHEDPIDVFRPTHFYLNKILSDEGFDVDLVLIGVGPLTVISEILLKYLKFSVLKIPIFIMILFFDKILSLISKDYKNYYLGIHCSCKKKIK